MNTRLPSIAKMTIGYAIGASLWILFSDLVLDGLTNPETASNLGIIKGLSFVALTSALLFLALHRFSSSKTDTLAPIRRFSWLQLVGTIAMAAGIGLIGLLTYSEQERSIKNSVFEQLQSVARLQVASISQWLNERKINAEALARDPLMINTLLEWQRQGGSPIPPGLEQFLDQAQKSYPFARIGLMDLDGRSISRSTTVPDASAYLTPETKRRLALGATTFLDFSEDGTNAIGEDVAFLVPIRTMDAAWPRTIAFIYFDVLAKEFLTPLISSWPVPSRTGEFLLGMRQGAQIRFLHAADLSNYQKLQLDNPVRSTEYVVPQFIRTGEHLLEGTDHRGNSVLAAAYTIPATQWILIAKIDRSESLSVVKSAAWIVGLLTIATMIIVFVVLSYLWQRSQLRDALNEVAHSRAKQLADNEFRAMFDHAAVGIAHLSLDGLVVRANDELEKMFAPSDERLVGQIVTDFSLPENKVADQTIFDEFRRGERERFSGERRYIKADGGEAWVSINTALVREDDGSPSYLIDVVTDITERKRDEARLLQSAKVISSAQEGIVVTDPSGDILTVNPAFCRITGYSESEIVGQNMRILQSGQHDRAFYRDMWLTIERVGFWQGEIWNRRKGGDVYPELLTISAIKNEQGKFVNYVGTFADITTQKESESLLTHLAHHDPLTDLPNRLMLTTRLSHGITRARRIKSKGALLFLDLDRFKNVNDSLGHPAGDELLLGVAQRLLDRLRESDTLARLGGDEFVILVEDIKDVSSVGALAQALLEEFNSPFRVLNEHEVYVGTSIGISIFPDDGDSAEQIIKHADAALYRAKEEGRGTYRFYTSALTERANVRLDMERRLRQALERDEFFLHFQPIISLSQDRIIGFEALVRWRSPDGALIPPGEFIPLAEETGIILPLGERVLRMACRQMQTWLANGHDFSMMAVNLSAKQFRLPDIDDTIRKVLADTGLPARYLELELTESALIDQGVGAEAKLEGLRDIGVRLSIDDFGTGYSSLAYLKRFPISKLKIDQSFVRDIPEDPADMEITAAIIGLARNLKMEVVAEGVETTAQLEFLKSSGCELAQGYLLGRPLPADELDEILDRRRLAG